MTLATVHSTCRECRRAVVLPANEVAVVTCEHDSRLVYTCPRCHAQTGHSLTTGQLDLMRSVGVREVVVDVEVVDAPALTEDDLIAFGQALEALE